MRRLLPNSFFQKNIQNNNSASEQLKNKHNNFFQKNVQNNKKTDNNSASEQLKNNLPLTRTKSSVNLQETFSMKQS